MIIMASPWKHPNGTFYIRRKVPEQLRPILNIGEFYKRSLGTKDAQVAKTRFAAELAKSEELFSLAAASLDGKPTLSAKDVQQIASRWFREELAKMEASGDFDHWLIIGADGVETLKAHSEGHLGSEHIKPFLREALENLRCPLPPEGSPDHVRLMDAFTDHLFKLSDIAAHRHAGHWTIKPDVLEFEPLSFETKRKASNIKTIMGLFEDYAADRISNDGDTRTTRKTLGEYRGIITQFIELYGDLPAKDIDRQRVGDYRAELGQMPRKGDGIRSLNAREQIARAERDGLETLSLSTIKKRLRVLSAVLGYGLQMGHLKENPVVSSGVIKRLTKSISNQAGTRRRKDYNEEELQAIFTGPVYTQGWKPPQTDLGEALYWIPLLALYTGARREELCQLFVSDVKRSREGIVYLSILDTDDEDARTVKTMGSRRSVPVHEDLLELGFMAYVEDLPPSGQLFPRLKKDAQGWYGKGFGTHWTKYLRGVVGLESPVSPSHGFRHTFKTKCREAGIPEEISDALSGHIDGSVSRDYGSMPLARMAEELKKFSGAPKLGLKRPAQ